MVTLGAITFEKKHAMMKMKWQFIFTIQNYQSTKEKKEDLFTQLKQHLPCQCHRHVENDPPPQNYLVKSPKMLN